jgi:putative ABC transport system permease protein
VWPDDPVSDLTLIGRNLTRQARRSALTVLAVGVCLFLFTALATVLEAVDHLVARARTHRRVVVHAATSLSIALPPSYGSRLAAIPDVEAIMSDVLMLGVGRRESALVCAQAVDPECYERVMYEQLPGEAEMARFRADRTAALVALPLARSEGLSIGDTYVVRALHRPVTLELKVAGFLRGNLNSAALFYHRRYFTEVADDHGANLYLLKVRSLDAMSSVVEAVERELADGPIAVDAEPEHTVVSSFLVGQQTVLALVRGIGCLVLVCIVLVAGNSMAMVVRERTREMGILRALGFSRARIELLIVGESLGLTLAGGLGGCVAAWLAFAWGRAACTGVMASLTVKSSTIATGLAVAALLGVLAGTLPARVAAGAPVDTALRHV